MLELQFTPFPQLETKRLLLRKMQPADAKALFFLRSDETVMQYIDKERAATINEASIFIQNILSWINTNQSINWAITVKENPDQLIGSIGYWRILKEHYRAEIGYMLHPDYWKKGLMKEAIQAVLDYGFQEMNLHSVEAHINPANNGSAAILESTGFVREAYFKEDYFFRGKFLDTAIYSRLNQEGK